MKKTSTLSLFQNQPERYDLVARFLHGTIAILIIGMIALGFYMTLTEGAKGSEFYFNLHKSLGILVLILVILRITWRLTHRFPSLPASIPRWQVKALHIVHGFLYIFILLMPLTGFLGVNFSSHPLAFFGFPLPKLFNGNAMASGWLFYLHGKFVWILITLIVIHVLAAFKHLWINKDGVFQRMI